MGLDVRIIQRRNVFCPECGAVVCHNDVNCIDSGGRAWYEPLEAVGYYVPYEQRTEENDWYGQDMILSNNNMKLIRDFVLNYDVYNRREIAGLIASAMVDGDQVVINADW